MSEEKTLYRCDPGRNLECRKLMCFQRGGFGGSVCRATTKQECAARDEAGNLIIEPRLRERRLARLRGETDGTD